ncbi:MAG: TIGR03619 family F420-dependent LLM class oxidoreductase [Acetobacteraceae bacterium]|nr:TIGR03619 family F420-dependent LLM class oxidoreductase [Acetobacteraceae bacterium]
MQFGFNAPTAGPLSAATPLAEICVGGEAMGYDYATFSDHVVIPTAIASTYPYSATGEFPAGARAPRHEQLTEVAWVAGKTSNLRLITSVMVVPHRPAMLTAKILSTIDVLSGGRLTLGIGAGWMEEEFIAVGAPPFAERGAVTDEYLQVFRELWTQPDPKFAGKYTRFDKILFEPKPAGIPIWVGGESGPALRRTARLADGWYPIGSNPAFPLDSLALLKAGIARLHKAADAVGRDRKALSVIYRVSAAPPTPARASDGGAKLFNGPDATVIADIRALRDLGIASIDFGFPGTTAAEVLANMQRFRTEVLAKV